MAKKRKVQIKGVIDGSILGNEKVAKQIPFVLYLCMLIMVYITIRYHAESLVRKEARLQNELKEMRAKSISTASELMFNSKQSVVAEEVKRRGLNLIEPQEPPMKLIVTEEDKEKLEDLRTN